MKEILDLLTAEPSGDKLRRVVNFAVNAKDGSVLVRIPGGEFEMGDGTGGDCPKHTIYLSEYWIGVYCVTNRQYAKFVKETGHRAPDNKLWQQEEKLEHPVTDVSWDDCEAYGKWAGLELPSEAQWEKAARGPLGLIYPWGKEWKEGKKCRIKENKGSETTAPVSGYAAGVSGYGMYQQSGNVWEWCADWYESDYYKKSPESDPRGPEGGSSRVNRGGSWGHNDALRFWGALRNRHNPSYGGDNLGFRLVRSSA
jgi:formylglycine-generating enzyme